MPTVRETKKLAFTCEQCRKRKVKCDGAEPRCRRCEARDEKCEYKQSPTLAYTQGLEARIRELEEEVSTLRARNSSLSPASTYASPAHPPPSSSSQGGGAATSATSTDDTAAIARDFKGLKIDERGVTTYHSSTSFFQLVDSAGAGVPGGPGQSTMGWQMDPSGKSPGSSSKGDDGNDDSKQRLVYNAWAQLAQEKQNLSNIPEPFQHLLQLHWCWVQPLFNFIYRPAFSRDMAIMGPYYSHALMNAIVSHSIRWGKADPKTRELLKNYEGGAVFARSARTMIFEELRRGIVTIPTVQALLLLSAQECSLGNSAQAWVYSGIAFRLLDHLGIVFDSQRYAGSVALTEEDIEIRRRLFWSCYFWDKLISLYLGRSPSLQHSTVSPPDHLLDDSAEEDFWVPHGVVYPEGAGYPAIKSHSTSAFVQMCRLSTIFNQILIHMYDPAHQNSEAEMLNCLAREEQSLDYWWQELPSFLKIQTNPPPPISPPSHVVVLNSLYHTIRILMYRPMLSSKLSGSSNAEGSPEPNPKHLIECVTSATSVVAIFNLFCRTFTENFSALSLTYCVYIASTIFLMQVQATPTDQQAKQRLEYCVHALMSVSKVNYVIRGAAMLIMKAITDLNLDISIPEIPVTPGQSSASQPMALKPESAESPFVAMSSDAAAQFPYYENLNLQENNIPPEMFKAVSGLTPMSIRPGTIDELSSHGYR